MLMRFFVLALSLSLLSPAYAKLIKNSSMMATRITEQRALPPFSEVVVKGKVNISLHTGYAKPKVILRGNALDLEAMLIAVKNNVLLVYRDEERRFYGPVQVEIRATSLSNFDYHGEGTITGTKLSSGNLALTIHNPGKTILGGNLILRKLHLKGDGYVEINGINSPHLRLAINDDTKVKLAGVINLAKLTLADGASLTAYWVKSKRLEVCARGRSYLQLGGIAEKLYVELWDRAHFNGRYLRAKNVFAKTHDKSIADITALEHQHTLATDASDVYFYNIPDTKADFMAFQGSVLDLRDWRPPDLEEYDRYNK